MNDCHSYPFFEKKMTWVLYLVVFNDAFDLMMRLILKLYFLAPHSN
ncbi:hypothetical protein HPHPA4_0001 [Helicobacter pylori Hp A-4]|nr:hypothetical protein [Helicobacter pylori]EJB40309.1 hypothetical protein HPHPA4_1690 [Helicobacter pylori Hp A-4]EJB41278.1 hypothetical protein HPHPA4_1236 [Helicobacter pylori Hp A-4]EJB43753.1 hypothetical protein HPHPA4_0001 [Helicobacter pylori Hp A-4]